MRGRHFLTLQDYTAAEITYLLDLAVELKGKQQQGEPHPFLAGKTLGMIFEKPSTRTRVSFEVGMWQLGGHALFLSSQELQIGRGEPIRDTAAVLSRYLDGMMIRTFAHSTVEELARHATVPVINGLTDRYHPCQALADLMTIRERKGSLRGLRVAYLGDGNNVAHSLMLGCTKLGVHINVGAPAGYWPLADVTANAEKNATVSGCDLIITSDPVAAVKGADVIYTDVWASMGQEHEKIKRRAIFAPFQVNKDIMAHAGPQVIVMHCLPA
ncbi:MAG TPA: ornithine carbamoyltransferase, partial [Firmicutes bacterium]|nr:ornithine carbamoyltransferase [Bacillota bacterium]